VSFFFQEEAPVFFPRNQKGEGKVRSAAALCKS